MADIIYPYESLPSPHFTSSGIKQVPSLLTSKMQSGRVRVRRSFRNVPANLTIRWKLTDGEAAVFKGWIDRDLGGGVSSFLLNIRLPGGVSLHNVQLLTNPYDDFKPDGSKWVFTAKAQMKVIPIISEELAILLGQHRLLDLEKAAKISGEMKL